MLRASCCMSCSCAPGAAATGSPVTDTWRRRLGLARGAGFQAHAHRRRGDRDATGVVVVERGQQRQLRWSASSGVLRQGAAAKASAPAPAPASPGRATAAGSAAAASERRSWRERPLGAGCSARGHDSCAQHGSSCSEAQSALVAAAGPGRARRSGGVDVLPAGWRRGRPKTRRAKLAASVWAASEHENC